MKQQNKLLYGWQEVELGDVLSFAPKSGKKAGEGIEQGKHKFFTSSSEQSKFINEFDFDGDYLILATGGKAGIHHCNGRFSASNDCFVLKTDNAFAKYVYYYLFSKIHLLEEGFKGAGLKHLSRNHLLCIKIPLPPLPTQKLIVSILEKADSLKQKREEADKLTKEYLQSVFKEMFYKKKFPIVKLKDIAIIERNSIPANQIKKGDKYVGLEHLESESGRIINIISVSEGDLKSNKFSFDENCVLYGKLRPYLNKIALPEFKGICSTDIVPIRSIKEKSNRYFISYILKQPYYIKLATDRSVGANLPRLSPRELESFEIIYPPLPLQNKFASIVKEVEQLKEQQKKSKEQIDNLFNALMQRAFKGELVR